MSVSQIEKNKPTFRSTRPVESSSATLAQSSNMRTYEYTRDTDLTDLQIQETIQTYNANAEEYSEQEWSEQSFKVVWQSVLSKLKDEIFELPENAKILFPGSGSAQSLLTLLFMRKDITATGYDISTKLLREGVNSLNWERVTRLAELIRVATQADSDNEKSRGWVNTIVNLLKLLTHMPELTERASEETLDSLQKRVNLLEGDITSSFFRPESFDMVLAVAVLPHLRKDQVLAAVLGMLNQLKPGRLLYFNVRYDPKTDTDSATTLKNGRVFKDNVIGGNRYFNTYTFSEIEDVLWRLRKKVPFESVVAFSLSHHFDKKKPQFINVTI